MTSVAALFLLLTTAVTFFGMPSIAQSPKARLETWRAQNHFVQRMMESKPQKKKKPLSSEIRPVVLVRSSHSFLEPKTQRKLDMITKSRLSSGNKLKLLLNHESSVAKFRLVEKAQTSLFVSALLLHCDVGGKKLVAKLIAASRRGVDVRIVIDGIGAWAGLGCFQTLRQAGIKIVISARSLSPASVDWEMHDKLFMQDGRRAVVGGQNLGSWYFDSNGTDDNYRDTDVLVEGPVVRDIARRFIRIWEEQQPLDASLESFVRELEELDIQDALEKRIGKKNYSQWLDVEGGKGVCRFVSQDPHRGTFHVFDAYTFLAEQSRQRVRFHAMSFEPTGSPRHARMLGALKKLAARPKGTVDVITNGPGLLTSKTMPSQLGSWFGSSFLSSTYNGLKDSEIRVHAYGTFLHSKVYSFDDVVVGIGSFNYDQSGIRCQESTLICVDAELSEDVQRMFERDLQNSAHVPVVEPPEK
ncbi:MAG: phosphatidylserine/phosphatidylglycerophosphate/cardiolipin synthase family protein [Deltaproteobacteria bacterium]|nr:phosphatidylserine/phosphatidylglycerophosphate/cardiolipin synthase family protein [Deltaproteobacteria bacterium]